MHTNALRTSDVLPTIHSVHQPIERYMELLAEVEPEPGPPALAMKPLDELLIAQVLGLQAARVTVIDLAAAASRGASTALVAVQANVQTVLEYRPTAGQHATTGRRFTLARFLQSQPAPTAPVESLTAELGSPDWHRTLTEMSKRSPLVFLLEAENTGTALVSQLAECLAAAPRALVLIVGVGAVGQDASLGPLLAFCGPSTEWNLRLLRDTSEVLASSQLAVVYGNSLRGAAEQTLERIQHLYTTNFPFLRLLNQTCQDAVQTAHLARHGAAAASYSWLPEFGGKIGELEYALQQTRQELGQLRQEHERSRKEEENLRRERDRYRQDAQRLRQESRRIQQALQEQLAQVQGSFSFRLASRVRQRLAPEGSLRGRCARKCIRAVRVWRAEGTRGLVTRVVRRFRPHRA